EVAKARAEVDVAKKRVQVRKDELAQVRARLDALQKAPEPVPAPVPPAPPKPDGVSAKTRAVQDLKLLVKDRSTKCDREREIALTLSRKSDEVRLAHQLGKATAEGVAKVQAQADDALERVVKYKKEMEEASVNLSAARSELEAEIEKAKAARPKK